MARFSHSLITGSILFGFPRYLWSPQPTVILHTTLSLFDQRIRPGFMKIIFAAIRQPKLLPFLFVLFLSWPLAVVAGDECASSGKDSFVCGLMNPEDLVLVPDSKWIIASGMAPGAAIYLVNAEKKTWAELYPADEPRAAQDMGLYGACPGTPDPNNFLSHGLNLRPGSGGHSTLYVAG